MTYVLHKPRIAIVGAGQIARCYVESLLVNGVDRACITIFGRGGMTSKLFAREMNMPVELFEGEESVQGYDVGIVATPIAQLFPCTLDLVKAGVKNVLVEKPVSFQKSDLERLLAVAEELGVNVSVALNRRFFSSVLALKSRIQADGGLQSLHFCFTERLKDAASGKHDKSERKYWGLANSIHVIDLAFHLIGEGIEELSVYGKSSVEQNKAWEGRQTVFAGSGVGKYGAMFSYSADWSGGGRWGIECSTKQGKYRLSPLEELQFMAIGQFETKLITGTDGQMGKPGFHEMCRLLLECPSELCGLAGFMESHKFISKVCGYEV